MIGKGWIVAGLLVLLGFIFAVRASGSDVPIDWKTTAPLSLPRHSGASAVVDGLIYVIGGVEYGNSMTVYGQTYDVTTGTLVEVYDPGADAWTRLADLPYPIDVMARRAEGRMWAAAAALGGKIYTFGGANLNDEVRGTIDVYDIATDTWTAGIAHLPEPVCGLSAATVGTTIYVFGGATSTNPYRPQDYVATCYAFDPATLSITPIAPMPLARFKTSAIPIEGGVLVLGGISATATSNAQIYRPKTDTWERLEPVFWERRFWGGAASDEVMFLVGGRDEHATTTGAVDVWIPEENAWLAGDPMSVPREDAFTVAIGGRLYVAGGRNHEGTPLADAECGTPNLGAVTYASLPEAEPLVTIEWSVGAPIPTPRYFGATAVVGGLIYVIGGLEAVDPTGRVVEIYDPATNTWTAGPPLPEGRFNVAAAVLDSTIYVFGGAAVGGGVTDTVYAYDPAKDTWKLLGSLPNAVAGIAAVTYEGRIYLFGGSHSSQMYVPKENYYDKAYAFDPATSTFESLPPMPVARNMAFAGAVEEGLFVIGGMKSPGATACQRYDPPIRTWTIMAEMPNPRGGHSGVVIRTLPTRGMYVLGGANQIDVYGYNWGEDRWFVATSIPAPRNLTFTAVVARSPERIYMIGGTDETGSVVDTVFIGEMAGEATPE
jgi:N-acetylneuraminic acid mutarotase